MSDGSRGPRPETGFARAASGASLQTAWGVAGLSALLAILMLVLQLRPRPSPEPERVLRAPLASPAASGFGGDHPTSDSNLAVSPDGRYVALVADNQLWVRPLREVDAVALEGTTGANFPFWSPDSETLGFFANDELRTVGISGGPVRTICEAPNARGGSWALDGTILLAPGPRTGIHRVDALGGEVEQVTEVDPDLHSTHRWPRFLPNGEDFVFLATSHSDPRGSHNGIYLASSSGGVPRMLTRADSGAVFSADRLLFLRLGDLMAQPFDPVQLTLTGEAVVVASGVRFRGDLWNGVFSASQTDVLAYETGPGQRGAQLTWMDSLGTAIGKLGDKDLFWDLRLSRTRNRLAVAAGSPSPALWIHDLETGEQIRWLADRGFARAPVWSPDGERLAFAALNGAGRLAMYVAPLDDAGAANLLLKSELDQKPTSWSPDGRWLVFDRGQPGATEIWALPIGGGGDPVPLVQDPPSAADGQVSPDGKWLLYTTRESGADQVYVTSFPEPDRRWLVSATGWAHHGRWSPLGDKVYFGTAQGLLMEVELRRRKRDDGLDIGMPRVLFSYRRDDSLFRGDEGFFDLAAEEEKLILAQGPPGARDPGLITLVVPWHVDLKAGN